MNSFSRPLSLRSSLYAFDVAVKRRLIDRRRDFLGYLHRRLSHHEDAEDVLQDFYMKAIRAAAQLKDDEKIDAWLDSILRSTLIDYYRRRDARQRAEAAYGLDVREVVLEGGADAGATPCRCVHDLLPTLRRDYAEILRRADIDEVPRERIAVDLGITSNNVGVRLHRARRALKERIEEHCETCHDDGYRSCGCSSGV